MNNYRKTPPPWSVRILVPGIIFIFSWLYCIFLLPQNWIRRAAWMLPEDSIVSSVSDMSIEVKINFGFETAVLVTFFAVSGFLWHTVSELVGITPKRTNKADREGKSSLDRIIHLLRTDLLFFSVSTISFAMFVLWWARNSFLGGPESFVFGHGRYFFAPTAAGADAFARVASGFFTSLFVVCYLDPMGFRKYMGIPEPPNSSETQVLVMPAVVGLGGLSGVGGCSFVILAGFYADFSPIAIASTVLMFASWARASWFSFGTSRNSVSNGIFRTFLLLLTVLAMLCVPIMVFVVPPALANLPSPPTWALGGCLPITVLIWLKISADQTASCLTQGGGLLLLFKVIKAGLALLFLAVGSTAISIWGVYGLPVHTPLPSLSTMLACTPAIIAAFVLLRSGFFSSHVCGFGSSAGLFGLFRYLSTGSARSVPFLSLVPPVVGVLAIIGAVYSIHTGSFRFCLQGSCVGLVAGTYRLLISHAPQEIASAYLPPLHTLLPFVPALIATFAFVYYRKLFQIPKAYMLGSGIGFVGVFRYLIQHGQSSTPLYFLGILPACLASVALIFWPQSLQSHSRIGYAFGSGSGILGFYRLLQAQPWIPVLVVTGLVICLAGLAARFVWRSKATLRRLGSTTSAYMLMLADLMTSAVMILGLFAICCIVVLYLISAVYQWSLLTVLMVSGTALVAYYNRTDPVAS